MKNTFLLLISLFAGSLSLHAQYTRFIYQVTMKTDSTDRAEVKTEKAFLDVSSEKSVFYGEARAKRDSLVERMRATRNFDRNAMQNLRSNIDYLVEKDPKKNTVSFSTRLGRDQYIYEEERQLSWKILPETVKIGVYEAQKAETFFAGRKWMAWFTQEIPFQDGPYKFKGLPGLILKVEDAQGDYSFDLMQTKKIPQMPSFDSRTTPIKVKRKDYQKQEELYRKDPVTFMTNAFTQGNFGGGQGGGRWMQIDPNARKQMEERLLEEVRKNNNPLELSK